jgi:hypothetical protein
MGTESKKEALEMTEDIMKLSLHYCKDPDEEISSYSVRINNIAHELNILIARKLTDQTHN